MKQINVGLDVGYGGLNVAYTNGSTRTGRIPAAFRRRTDFGPLRHAGWRRKGDRQRCRGDGGRRAVGRWDRPLLIDSGHTRVHSASYIDSNEFLALVHAGLKLIGAPVIDTLVTGVPVSEFFGEPKKIEGLKRRLCAIRNLDGDMQVQVSRVVVVPQPFGACSDTLSRLMRDGDRGARMLRQGYTTLTIDPGHYSVDWVLFRGPNIVGKSSSSSKQAGRHVIRSVLNAIQERHGKRLTEVMVESAIDCGNATLDVGKASVPLRPLIDEAARAAIGQVLKDVEASLGAKFDMTNAVILAGGGASLYGAAVAERFPDAQVELSPQPVLANARGFWLQAGQPNRAAA